MAKINFTPISIGVADQKVPAVKFLSWCVPEEFECDFYSNALLNGKTASWYVSLSISVADDGAPRATSIKIYSDFQSKKPEGYFKEGLSRWQLEAIESNLHNLLADAIDHCVRQVAYNPKARGPKQKRWEFSFDGNWASKDESKKIVKEAQKLSHRRVNNPEHLKKVAKIYNDELARASRSKTRGRMTQEVMIQMNTKQGTAELWIRNAKNAKSIKDTKLTKKAPKKVSAPKAGSKSKSKAKKGE